MRSASSLNITTHCDAKESTGTPNNSGLLSIKAHEDLVASSSKADVELAAVRRVAKSVQIDIYNCIGTTYTPAIYYYDPENGLRPEHGQAGKHCKSMQAVNVEL